MERRPLGKTGIEVSAVGYGAMALSLEGGPPEAESVAILQQLLGGGVTFFDTADTYCRGPGDLHHNERLLARALAARQGGPEPVCVATKGGTVRTASGWEIDGTPDRLYRGICASFQALGGKEPISIWQHHWPDPRYSIAAMMKPVRRAVEEGLVRFIGVGNYSVQQLREVRDVLPVVSVQNQFNLWHREPEEDGMLEYCEREDIVFLPWRPLGGLGLAHRLGEIRPVADLARERGISPQRLMISWHLAKSKCIFPIPGSSRVENVLDCLAAREVRLEPREIARLDAVPPAELPRRTRPPAWEQAPGLARHKNASS